MNSELEIQAYLDNELTSAEARRVALRLDKDPAGAELYRELRETRKALIEGEPEHKLSDSRDFYFAQIVQKIDRAEAQAAEGRVEIPWWRRAVAPVAGFAAVAAVAFLLARTATPGTHFAQETGTAAQETGAITFRSHADGMTIVWIDGQKGFNE
jgi:anti-sigma factor RsiW